MACPYFIPTGFLAGDLFIHRARLPLGDGFTGRCCAPGQAGDCPSEDELRMFCNIGYPATYKVRCSRCPSERDWDCVRLVVQSERGGLIVVTYVCERNFLPIEHGTLEFDRKSGTWGKAHPDLRVQSKAQAFLRTWLITHPARRECAE